MRMPQGFCTLSGLVRGRTYKGRMCEELYASFFAMAFSLLTLGLFKTLRLACPQVLLNHVVKLRLHLVAKVFLHGVHVGEFSKSPASELLCVVDTGQPAGMHGGFFVFSVFAPVAFDFYHQIEQVVWSSAVLDFHNEVWSIGARGGSNKVRDLKVQAVVFHVRKNPGVAFGHAAKLGFPITIQNDPVDMAAGRIRLPAA